MSGRPALKRLPQIKPLRVVTRRSTDVLTTEDAIVAQALRFVREHACRPISVTDVATHVHVPRTTLQIRVKNGIGRTLHKEIKRVRVARAKELLSATSMPIKQVALKCGFKNVQYFTRAFHQATGQTPAQFQGPFFSAHTHMP